ncbi:YncE family protein [Betaproteobacteria bacterium]|nr:YncE family protein [Betaproteobacteria bacterium]
MNDLSKIFVGLGLLCSVLSAGADVKVFVTNQGSDSVTVFSFDGKFELLREVQVGKAPAGLALSTVNREAYISNTESSEISVIDVDSLEVKKTIDLNGSSLGVAVSPDGKRLFVSDWFNNCLLVIQLNSHKKRCIEVGKAPAGISVSEKNDEIYVVSRDSNSVFVVSLSEEKVIGKILVGDHPFGLKLLPVKNHLYVTNVQSNDVSIVDLTERQEIKRVKVGKKPYCITFSMDGKKSFVTNQYSDSISIIDTELLLLKKTISSVSFPEGIDTHGPFIIFVSWLDEEIIAIDERSQSVVSYASTGMNPRNFGDFIFVE